MVAGVKRAHSRSRTGPVASTALRGAAASPHAAPALDRRPDVGSSDGRAPGSLLTLTFGLAVAVRAVHAAITDPAFTSRGDNSFFVAVARSVATGHWGRLPTMDGPEAMSVKFPPLWPWTLGAGQKILWFLPQDKANAAWSILVGASVAPLAGLLAWRVLDRLPAHRRRLIAAGAALLAALHPLLIGATTSLMSEVMVVPITLAILLMLDRIQRRGPRAGSLLALGALTALAALLRFEALYMWGAVIVAVAVMTHSRRTAMIPLAMALIPALAFSVVATRAAHEPVLVSTDAASAVAGSNCHSTLSGQAIGHWSKTCLNEVWLGRIPPNRRAVIYAYERQPTNRFPHQLGPRLEGRLQDAQRRASVYAIRHHPVLFVRAVPVRIARALGLWWSPDQTRLEQAEGRIIGWEVAGRWLHLLGVLPPFLIAAAGLLWRRSSLATMLDRCADRRRLAPYAIAVGLWLAGVVLTHGSTRHRAPVDAVFLIGATLGYAMLLNRSTGSTAPDRDGAAAR